MEPVPRARAGLGGSLAAAGWETEQFVGTRSFLPARLPQATFSGQEQRPQPTPYGHGFLSALPSAGQCGPVTQRLCATPGHSPPTVADTQPARLPPRCFSHSLSLRQIPPGAGIYSWALKMQRTRHNREVMTSCGLWSQEEGTIRSFVAHCH